MCYSKALKIGKTEGLGEKNTVPESLYLYALSTIMLI